MQVGADACKGAFLYLFGRDVESGEMLVRPLPCITCAKHIVRVGIEAVYTYALSEDEEHPIAIESMSPIAIYEYRKREIGLT